MHRLKDREVPIDLSNGLILVGGKGGKDGEDRSIILTESVSIPKSITET